MAKRKPQQPPKEIKGLEAAPDVRLLPVSAVHTNPHNPKRPISKDRARGLNRSMETFGFAGAILVAPHPDIEGEFVILDGNTRAEQLSKRNVQNLPCIVVPNIHTWDDVKRFAITYDRNVKAYDEDMVIAQLTELAQNGEDIDLLSELANIPRLDEIINNDYNADTLEEEERALQELLDMAATQQATMMLNGSQVEIDSIKNLLKSIKGKMSQAEKVNNLLMAIDKSFDFATDEDFLLALLVTLTHYGGSLDAPMVIPCVSADQKHVIMRKCYDLIKHENLTGDFAVSRALEYMLASYEVGIDG